MELTEFVSARLAEDEARARRIIDVWERAERPLEDFGRYLIDPIIGPFGGQSRVRDVSFGLYVADVAHPARVLAQVEAMRRIVEFRYSWNLEAERNPEPPFGPALQVKVSGADAILRALATIWRDHPDFNLAWEV